MTPPDAPEPRTVAEHGGEEINSPPEVEREDEHMESEARG